LTHSASLYTRLGAVERWQQAYGGLSAIELMRGRLPQAQSWLDKLRPPGHELPAQIAAYLHAFGASLAIIQGRALAEFVMRLREVTAARELARFDRVLCQGLIATCCWRLDDRTAAVEAAHDGLANLLSGVPAAWYVTDGIAGIAQTLIDASACGLASPSDAWRACRILRSYARATKVALPRAALLSGRFAAGSGSKRLALSRWRKGLGAARSLGAGYDEALLLHELGTHGPRPERARFLEEAHAQYERLGAMPQQGGRALP
jgi:adenylate cyclase